MDNWATKREITSVIAKGTLLPLISNADVPTVSEFGDDIIDGFA